MSPTTRIVVFNFWEFAAFLTNSFIFLIIGLEIELTMLVENGPAILWGILAVLASRAVVIYGLASLRQNLPTRWKNILYWGGLRGAISLALALSLPVALPHRAQLQAMAFGVVLFTLIVQGLTMQPLMKRSGVVQQTENELRYEQARAHGAAIRAARARIQRLHQDGTVSDFAVRRLARIFDQLGNRAADQMHAALEAEPRLRQEELVDAWREGLRAQRSAITALFRDGIIGEDTYAGLVADIDFFLANPEGDWPILDDLLARDPESQ
jgi:CPA1 family monovalent cation:H+ antiporter